jgi:hypothetical protein
MREKKVGNLDGRGGINLIFPDDFFFDELLV